MYFANINSSSEGGVDCWTVAYNKNIIRNITRDSRCELVDPHFTLCAWKWSVFLFVLSSVFFSLLLSQCLCNFIVCPMIPLHFLLLLVLLFFFLWQMIWHIRATLFPHFWSDSLFFIDPCVFGRSYFSTNSAVFSALSFLS